MKLTALPLTLLFLFLLNQKLPAQSPLAEFGIYGADEINMKECPFDKDANAVVLLDEGFSSYDENWQLITVRRIRIKILNEKGIDEGNITIPFYSKDKFEFIKNIQGITYTANQNPVISNLDRKSIYTEKLDEQRSRIKFAMPNVRAGSIVEYKYESVMKHYGGLDRWIFQSNMPTLKSCFLLQILPNAEFSYVITKKPDYKIIVTPKTDMGEIYFEMNSIPGLRFEPYMDAPKDYFQQVEFQLAGYLNTFGTKQTVNATWRSIATDLSIDKALGGTVKKDLLKIDEVKALVEKETTLIKKINAVYDYVKNNFTWNGYDSKYAIDGLKKVWEKRTGNSGEINLILISLLQTFDIDASPLLVAERDFGRVDPKLPFIDRFNKTVAYVTAEDKVFILDATQKFCPAGLTPYPLLNTFGLIVSRKTTNLINLKHDNEAFFSQVTVRATLDKTGLLTGKSVIKSDQYAKQLQSEKITKNEKDFIKEYEENNPGISIDSFAYENLEGADPLTQHINFSEQFDKSDGFVLLTYNLFTGLAKNLFTKDERFTNVDFGYPYHVSIEETIELPAGTKVEAIPPDKRIVTPERDISIAREIKQTGNTLQIKINFVQTVTLISYEDYPGLKNFYKLIVTALNEPITVKLAN